MFRDLIGLAKTIEMLNDPIVTQESGARKRLKMIAPNISQEDLDDVVLNAKNMNKKKGAMERAISIMRKNMPWEDRDFVDERDLVLKTLQSEGGLLNPQAVDLYPEKIQTEGLRQ